MADPAENLRRGAKLFDERNSVYGDNWRNVGPTMAALFPNGVMLRTAHDWNRMHIFLLAIVKKTRYATNWENGGHKDSIQDETVYNAMLEAIDDEGK